MATLDAHITREMRGPSLTIWMSAAALFVFILWAAFAWVDEIVRADGEIISSSRPQIIQNLEGGILAELLVREGDIVEQGDVLARLYGTQFQSSVQDIGDQIDALDIRRMRLEAEMAGKASFQVTRSMFERNPEMVRSEAALLTARQSDFESRKRGAQKVLDQAAKERALMENMLERKVVALIEVTRARKAHGDAEIKYNEIVTQTELERAQEYSDTLKELGSLRAALKASQDQLNRTVLEAPMRGVVNNLSVTTIGGVVKPGEEIAQITPLDDELYLEAQVKPKDIANIQPGQAASIKLSAYDYTIYGTLQARVEVISADTFKDERKAEDDAHYKVTLKIDKDALSDRQKGLDLRPGMQATVELHTGQKTFLQYLLKPLYKSREAFREP